jgi:hypothetical protein
MAATLTAGAHRGYGPAGRCVGPQGRRVAFQRPTGGPPPCSLTSRRLLDQKSGDNPATGEQPAMAVVTISAFEVPRDRIDQVVEIWQRYSQLLTKQPGYISSRLHRATEPGTRFPLVNVSEWKSEQDYHNAVEQMIAELGMPNVPGLRVHPAIYETVA